MNQVLDSSPFLPICRDVLQNVVQNEKRNVKMQNTQNETERQRAQKRRNRRLDRMKAPVFAVFADRFNEDSEFSEQFANEANALAFAGMQDETCLGVLNSQEHKEWKEAVHTD